MSIPLRAAVCIGAIAGVFTALTPLGTVMVALTVAVAWLVRRHATDGRFVSRLLLAGMGARIVASLALHTWHALRYPGVQVALTWDSGGYLSMAERMVWAMRGYFPSLQNAIEMMTPPNAKNEWYGFNGYVAMLGSVFYGFGISPFAGIFINGLLYMIVVLLVYQMTATLFGRSAARLAGVLTAFFPSTFYWSINNGKETSSTLALTAICWAILQWRRTPRRVWYLLVAAIGVCGLFSVKPFEAVAVLGLLVLYGGWLLCRRVPAIGLVSVIGLAWFVAMREAPGWIDRTSKRGPITTLYYEGIRQCLGKNNVYLNNPGEGHMIYQPEKYAIYRPGMLAANDSLDDVKFKQSAFYAGMLRGMAYVALTFVPPWDVRKPSQLAMLPQVWLGYFLLPWGLLGLIQAVRRDGSGAGFGVLVVVVLSSLFGGTEAVIGTALRHRDLILPFYVMYASGGLVVGLSWSARQRMAGGPVEART